METSPRSRFVDDPVASGSGQFALGRPADCPPEPDAPSPPGLRPWGLRAAAPMPVAGDRWPAWAYDHRRQLAVDTEGRPLVERTTMGPPTANTTPPTDGVDPPSGEDWRNDFTLDEPYQP